LSPTHRKEAAAVSRNAADRSRKVLAESTARNEASFKKAKAAMIDLSSESNEVA
jgi:hypothetical protein